MKASEIREGQWYRGKSGKRFAHWIIGSSIQFITSTAKQRVMSLKEFAKWAKEEVK